MTLSRARLLKLAVAGAAFFALPRAASSALRKSSALAASVRNAGRRYAGDTPLFATVSPGVPGRDSALITLELRQRSTILLEAVRSAKHTGTVVWTDDATLEAGTHELPWQPSPTLPVGSYVLRITSTDGVGHQRILGGRRPLSAERTSAPVVRVLGVEGSFERRSYGPGERARLTLLADASLLSLQFLRCGTEAEATNRNDEMKGTLVGEPVQLDWTGKRSAPATVELDLGQWPTGLYAARIGTEDGRVGFAPFVIRPAQPGAATRIAVVMPTNTWQAYNYYDADRDGWGDTWYAGGDPAVDLTRPYRDRGVPPRYRRYDLPFLKWLTWTGKTVDMLTDEDLEAFRSGEGLRHLYDLVVFPGHSEYMTTRAYDIVERYRDLGGRLIFLSANNFFWRVDRSGSTIKRIKLWRNLARPEASLLGAQYRGNDDGSRQAPYVVTDVELAPWLYAGTGLASGSTIGEPVGGYGIEIDATTPQSPPGTIVLAEIKDIYGPGYTAQMTYYETPAGARVFSAGVLDFSASANIWPVRRMLENLWHHMLANLPAPPV